MVKALKDAGKIHSLLARFPRTFLILGAIIAATVPVKVDRLDLAPQGAALSAQFKQLSGPPDEFADMAPADPVRSATHSKKIGRAHV